MKKLLLLLAVLLPALQINAQDIITKLNGEKIKAKVESVTKTEVQYRKWSNPKGPLYTIGVDELESIRYTNGETDTFSAPTPVAVPTTSFKETPADDFTSGSVMLNNSNSKPMSDLELLRIYDNSEYFKLRKKTKTFKILGWTVGPALVIGGTLLILSDNGYYEPGVIYGLGVPLAAIGVATTVGCLYISHNSYVKADKLLTSSIWNHNISLNNGSNFNIGIDAMAYGNSLNNRTLGVGLRYNF